MTRRLFDFRCTYCDHTFGELIDDTKHKAECPNCGLKAKRIVSPVRIDWRKMGVDPDFPTCAERWDKAHERPADKE